MMTEYIGILPKRYRDLYYGNMDEEDINEEFEFLGDVLMSATHIDDWELEHDKWKIQDMVENYEKYNGTLL